VRRPRRRPARKRDEEPAPRRDRLVGGTEELAGSPARERRRIREDAPLLQSLRQRRPSSSMNALEATSGPIVPAG